MADTTANRPTRTRRIRGLRLGVAKALFSQPQTETADERHEREESAILNAKRL